MNNVSENTHNSYGSQSQRYTQKSYKLIGPDDDNLSEEEQTVKVDNTSGIFAQRADSFVPSLPLTSQSKPTLEKQSLEENVAQTAPAADAIESKEADLEMLQLKTE